MINSFLISFSLKNTYRVNGILYSIKQIPLIGRIIPSSLYSVSGLKVLANVISAIWEVISIFAGKAIYLSIMFFGVQSVFENVQISHSAIFLHALFFLTIVGALMNTYMFNPSNDKYYAMILMRMDAKKYTLTNYGYAILKVIVGFIPFTILFGSLLSLPLWLCAILPFFIAGMKLIVAAIYLIIYDKTGKTVNENGPSAAVWIFIVLLFVAAFGLPAAGIALPEIVFIIAVAAAIVAGVLSCVKIAGFGEYRQMYHKILVNAKSQVQSKQTAVRDRSRKFISADTNIKSSRKGFEYFNDLFIKRHQRILWKSTLKLTAVCICLVLAAIAAVYMLPEIHADVNSLLMVYLPYFVFIMYAINRGIGFTQALFMNCDHSMLTYSFYKQPKSILKLFVIRLREIIKINLPPAVVIGIGLSALLFVSGGTDNPLNYAVFVVSIIALSIFFSVHHLTMYYLLQPYNAGIEMKSGTYKVVSLVTYFVCFAFMQMRLPTFTFGITAICFCVLYCIVASLLIYKLAPQTFRLRV